MKIESGVRRRHPARAFPVQKELRILACRACSSLAILSAFSFPASAEDAFGKINTPFGVEVGTFEVIQFAMFLGAMGAALLSAGWLIRERSRIANENRQLRDKVADLNVTVQRNEAMLNLKDQRIIVWEGGSSTPNLIGNLPPEIGVPEPRSLFLAFGRWLRVDSVTLLDRSIAALREKARPFDITVETTKGAPLEIQGRTSGGYAIVRFINLGEARAEQALLKTENYQLSEAIGTLRGLLESVDMPAWSRDADGRLNWANLAYAKAVEARDPHAAVSEARELFGAQARERMEREKAASRRFNEQVSTVVGGDRRVFRVTDVAGTTGSAGVAVDISEVELIREEYKQTVLNHSDTLDQLNSAVAMFDANRKLQFFNQAFAKVWGLETAFLESHPDNSMLLDRFRSDGILPEQPDWRRWKEQVLSAYHSVEPQEHLWYLTDGRTLRVIVNPQPKGGVTWVFENLTEKLELQSRYNTLIKVQGQTLDHLAEGVAVFGSDGKIRLFNPAFASLWSLKKEQIAEGMHISAVRRLCEPVSDAAHWEAFVTTVTGFDDERQSLSGHIELSTGKILSYATAPLPNGQTMLTFVNVTDSVQVERALKEKNEALERTDELKNDFVQHVSYELRSPLTNIIGFTELLQTPMTGPLNEKQRDYLDHIGTSSSVLLTIVNDILDLATVDAGIMELDISDVSVADAITTASEKVADRLKEHNILLDIRITPGAGSFRADASRVKQVLANLLSNAANYAPEGSTVTLSCWREQAEMVFSVEDKGPGMPGYVLDSIFKRFQPYPNGGRKRGAGLGLSIVKGFVELHGGTVDIESAAGKGTLVTCRFPLEARTFSIAAE
ncbi:PAS domain-containing protein [Phyllobacterium sp. SYP-B3895]|uniref:sensor histidine kinase n=1 Tax=Phyllobacterium sp. SYP-B3895 TaxID=2663240 RepID=UPI001299C075|nr:PAS domain-containing sensor histidine kinase [Phyllobacterium sp. SYP-B3895]MRG54693.1 PAS domain-containing protein [Phyllobacterium sp. SYP-B3895]